METYSWKYISIREVILLSYKRKKEEREKECDKEHAKEKEER
jgi:hypothetical protein